MDASVFFGPAIGAGVTLVLLAGAHFLREGARRQRLDEHDKKFEEQDRRLARCESKHVKIAEHEIKIGDLERRVATHKHDLKEDIARIERKMNGHK